MLSWRWLLVALVLASVSVVWLRPDRAETDWERVTEAAPWHPMDGAQTVVFDGRMWSIGGWGYDWPLQSHSEVWHSTDGRDWVREPDAPWEARHEGGVAVFRDRIWIVGGDSNQGHHQSDVWSSADGVTWELVADDVPWADRATHHVVVFDDRLWVMGGQVVNFDDGEGPEVLYNDVWSSDDGADWVLETADAGWSPRGQIGGAAVFDDRMWIIGGGTYDVRRYYNDVWSSADGVTWTQELAEAPWEPRQYHEVAVFDDKLWVIGGWDGQADRNDVWYSEDGVIWHELAETPWPGRHATSAWVFDDALWIGAGYLWNDVWRLPGFSEPYIDSID